MKRKLVPSIILILVVMLSLAAPISAASVRCDICAEWTEHKWVLSTAAYHEHICAVCGSSSGKAHHRLMRSGNAAWCIDCGYLTNNG